MTPTPAAAAIPTPGSAIRRARRATLPRPTQPGRRVEVRADFRNVRDELRARIAYRAGVRGLSFALEDLLATTDLALCLALRAWRPECGEFKPFAWHYVKRETLRHLQRESRLRKARRDLEALGMPFVVTQCTVPLDVAMRQCDPDALALARAHWLDGVSLRELSRTRGLSFRHVHTAITATRTQLSQMNDMMRFLS